MKIFSHVSTKTLAFALCAVAAPAAYAQDQDPGVVAPDEGEGAGEVIIVTGTRAEGATAAESAAPIKVIGAEALSHVGQPNLNQVLTQLVPSFTAQAFGGDTANLTLSARLRGLSPNHTLVLVNGKRRHGTANLAVLSGPYQGSATADIDLISPASIAQVEVLEDGAAAQYGSDAIAGVINIILKNDHEDFSGYVTGGRTYDYGGDTAATSLHLAVPIENGYLNVTGFYRYHDFSQIGGTDRRVTDPAGNLRTDLSPTIQALYANIPGFPYVNKINGDARSYLLNAQYNAGYNFGGVEVYSFGSYSNRKASAYENLRTPDRVIASPVLGVRGAVDTPGELILYPQGFSPREGLKEDDFAFTGGVRGDAGQLHWDLSATYGRDQEKIYTYGSANASLYVDTHDTPYNFYDGSFTARELTANADFVYRVDAGLAEPINIAAGGEYRKNWYAIGAGDAASIYKEGGQSFPGFRPSDAGENTRNNKSGYVDIAVQPIEAFQIDGAVRYEHYSDFGSEWIYKGTARFDITPEIAVRGTAASGFRAPTLAESYYSATNVSPTSAFVQLPANSAAAKLLGFNNLQPEKSKNYSAGLVLRPVQRLTLTIDAYQIKIRNRILGTGSIFGSGGAVNFPIVTQAIIANGNQLDPTVSQTGINIFTNGANTRTRGIEGVLSYASDFGDAGTVNWTVSGNYNETKVTSIQLAPAQLTPAGSTTPIALFNETAISNLEDASPKFKVIASAFWTLGKLSATIRGTVYGKTSQRNSPDGGTYYTLKIPTTFIGDAEVNYKIIPGIELTVGANNIFNKKSPIVPYIGTSVPYTVVNGGNVYDSPMSFSPYGINGGYYYGRINFDF